MHILVTGGAGFIGSNLVHFLMERRPDCRLTVLDSLTYAGCRENLARWEGDPRFRFVEGGITDPEAVDRAMEGAVACLHLAAETHVDRSIHDGAQFIATNVGGTQVLLDAARRHRLERFVLVSTDEVYGSIAEGSFHEEDSLQPSSPYSASKAGADLLALAHHNTYGTPVVITRCTNNFGPYQYPEKLIPFFLSQALEGRELPVYGDGLQVRDWIYVEDHCAALATVLDRGAVGGIYNVGAGHEVTNLEITRTLLELVGKPSSLVRHVQDRPGHDRRYSVDTARLRALGWAPRHGFREALERTVAWYRDNRPWWEALRRRREEYQRFYDQQYGARLAGK